MLITLLNVYKRKEQIVEQSVECHREYLLERTSHINNSFLSAFYEQAIESTVADSYEYFVENVSQNNVFYQNLKSMNKETGKRFLKMMSMYHSIKILRKKRNELQVEPMKEAMTYVFELNEAELRLFHLLYTCACQYPFQFEKMFAVSLYRYLYGKEISNPFVLAFIENFCYNSYQSFLLSFTRYITINRRLKKAAEESGHAKKVPATSF